MRFLVVDQTFESRLQIKKILHAFGDVDIAIDGEECVFAFLSALKRGEPYDLITLDALMPCMNGEETLREIREIEKELSFSMGRPLTRVIVTSEARKEELFEAFCFGKSSVYMTKPINHDTLISEVNKLIKHHQSRKAV